MNKASIFLSVALIVLSAFFIPIHTHSLQFINLANRALIGKETSLTDILDLINNPEFDSDQPLQFLDGLTPLQKAASEGNMTAVIKLSNYANKENMEKAHQLAAQANHYLISNYLTPFQPIIGPPVSEPTKKEIEDFKIYIEKASRGHLGHYCSGLKKVAGIIKKLIIEYKDKNQINKIIRLLEEKEK